MNSDSETEGTPSNWAEKEAYLSPGEIKGYGLADARLFFELEQRHKDLD